ncbi:hypothetical protein ACI2OX_21395 [Bacillus sp. N9]
MKNKFTLKLFAVLMVAAFMLIGCSANQKESNEQQEEKTNTSQTDQSEARVIGIIGAMEEEVEILREKWKLKRLKRSQEWIFIKEH